MKKVKEHTESITTMLEKNYKKTHYVFLGIGMTLFIMNITAFISFIKDMNYDFLFFNTAIFSSIILVLITVYYINEDTKE